jgi:hypothetical protein
MAPVSDASAGSYQSVRRLARLTVLLLTLTILALVVSALSSYGQILLVGDILAGAPFPEQEWETSFARAGVIANVGLGLYAATGIAFLFWAYRAYRNLHAFGVQGLQHSAGWAVGAWFVPFVNLVRPYQVMQEIYQASALDLDPAVPLHWAPRRSSLLSWWWAFWIGHSLLSVGVTTLGRSADTLALFVRASRWQLTADLAEAVGAVLAIMVVGAITARQEARWERLQQEPAPVEPVVEA